MSERQQFRDGEKHLSQIPALHLLQKMAPNWVMLSKAEVDRERRGKALERAVGRHSACPAYEAQRDRAPRSALSILRSQHPDGASRGCEVENRLD